MSLHQIPSSCCICVWQGRTDTERACVKTCSASFICKDISQINVTSKAYNQPLSCHFGFTVNCGKKKKCQLSKQHFHRNATSPTHGALLKKNKTLLNFVLGQPLTRKKYYLKKYFWLWNTAFSVFNTVKSTVPPQQLQFSTSYSSGSFSSEVVWLISLDTLDKRLHTKPSVLCWRGWRQPSGHKFSGRISGGCWRAEMLFTHDHHMTTTQLCCCSCNALKY